MDIQTQLNFATGIQILWLIASGVWLLRRRDETPLIVSGMLFYVFGFRFWAIISGGSAPVDITPFGFEPMSIESALDADWTAILGQTFLVGSYFFAQDRVLPRGVPSVPPAFLNWLRPRIFIFAAVAIPVSALARYITGLQLDSGKSMAFEMSAYLYELPFVVISVAILLALLWKCGGIPDRLHQIIAAVIFVIITYITFQPSGRFQFLGWVLAVTFIATSGDNMRKRATKLAIGLGLALTLFAFAGALRNSDEGADLKKDAWERFVFAEDANMLDGLALLRQVYPAMLPYEYGGGHLEIVQRPIPRAWWPDKPVGGYMNKLGITSVDTGFTLGISPGLVGSFYSEGGLLAVVLFSALYGWGMGRLVRYSREIAAVAGALIRAVCCAALIPLLRGGDLPGIYAWIFMSFWPCFVVLWIWRRQFFANRQASGRLPAISPGNTLRPASLTLGVSS